MGMFEGLTQLEELYLSGNPGAPFTFDLQPLDLGANAFDVAVGGGPPPFSISGTVSATGGTINFHNVAMTGGGRDVSPVITVKHSGDSPATITVTNTAFTSGKHSGITAANGTTLSVAKDGPTRGICSRTREIQDQILHLLHKHCAMVTEGDLASITKPFAVVGTDMKDPRPGDLAGLTEVRDLYLYGNQINELPDDFFKSAGSFDRVLLQDNPGASFPLVVKAVKKPNNKVAAVVDQGTPFHIEVQMAITGGTLGETTPHIGPGATSGADVTVYPTGAMDDVEVSIESATYVDIGLSAYSYYDGFMLSTEADQTAQTIRTATAETAATPESTPNPTPVVALPGKPTGLTTSVQDGNIVLNWTAPADSTVTGYQIFRRIPSKGQNKFSVLVEDTGDAVTTYTDDAVTQGRKHVYRVKAINDAGASTWSRYANAVP